MAKNEDNWLANYEALKACVSEHKDKILTQNLAENEGGVVL